MKRLALLLIIVLLQIVCGESLFAQSNNQNPTLNGQEQSRKEEKTRNLSLPEAVFDSLIAKAEANGLIRVTVDVNSITIRNLPSKQMMESQWRLQQRREKIRKELLGQLAKFNVSDIERGANADRVIMTVNADALKFLKKKYINDITINEAPAKEETPTISREKRDARIDELIKKAEREGTVSVIVNLDERIKRADPEALKAREKLLNDLTRYNVKITTDWTVYITMTVNAEALRFMKNQPIVASIGENAAGTIASQQRNVMIDELIKKAEAKGTISVIVAFKGVETTAPEALEAREKILKELVKYDVKITTKEITTDGMKQIAKYVTMTVNADALRFMKNQPFIESIGENGRNRIGTWDV